jgi:NTE family protein
MVKETFDFDKEYGIVLEGGGAKGAYQIGVWKALIEYGIKIKGIAGVSVGALNGALMCMGDYEKAIDIWTNISYSKILRVDDEQMEKLINGKFKELSLQTMKQTGKYLFVDGGLDATPLRELIDECVDEKKIRESEVEFIMGTFNLSDMKETEISAKEAEEGYLKDYLLASSNFPLFKNEKLMGKKFLDGGIANNVPIDMLINRGYKNIIVVRIFGIGVEKKVKIPEDVNVIYIAPKINLCNVLEFTKKKATRNITLGYYDALRVLQPLAGNFYYIKSHKSEKDYLNTMLRLEDEQIKALLTLRKQQDIPIGGSAIRKLTEEIYPWLATIFKLGKNWDYGDLYYAILEYCARKLRIQRYRIYTDEEFCALLHDKLKERMRIEGKLDVFMNLVLSFIENDV